jgi:hypothetical protein
MLGHPSPAWVQELAAGHELACAGVFWQMRVGMGGSGRLWP